MDLGQYQLQIFVSVLVILGAAFVALICDFLKGNNERLRELTIELKVRREEEQRHGRTVLAQEYPLPQTTVQRVAQPAAIAAPAPSALPKPSARPAPAATAVSPAPQTAPTPKTAAPKAAASAPRRAVSADAIAAMERGALRAGTRETNLPPVTGSSATIATTVPPAPQPAPAEQSSAARTDWAALLARRANNRIEKPAEAAPAAAEIVPATLPGGFHDGFVLTQLIQDKRPVTGLVVSIGVSATSKTGAAVPDAVHGLVRSLIGADDFACASGQDEFLLIYPRLNGAEAQRQLSRVAQQLWDFQLRTLGATSILFSWGGVEVASRSIEEAVASASERMQETRRGRKLITMPVRQAV